MKIIFEKWFNNGNKVISLESYKGSWSKPDFWFHTNGAKRKNGDKCFDFNIHFFYLAFSYTNFNLQNQNMKNLQIKEIKENEWHKIENKNDLPWEEGVYEFRDKDGEIEEVYIQWDDNDDCNIGWEYYDAWRSKTTH